MSLFIIKNNFTVHSSLLTLKNEDVGWKIIKLTRGLLHIVGMVEEERMTDVF